MSLDAYRSAWGVKARPTDKLVLLSLVNRAGKDYTCSPLIRDLVCDTGLDRKTVITSISRLTQAGHIEYTGEKVGRTKSVKKYRLLGVIGGQNAKNV